MLAAERKAFDECGCGHGLHGHDGQNEHDHDRGHGHTEECHEHHEHIDEAHNHIGHSHAHECGGQDHAGHDHGGHQHDGSCGCGHEEAHTGQEFAQVSAGVPQKVYILENLSCANCAAKMEEQIRKMPEVEMATITYATKQLKVAAREQEKLLPTFR